MKKLFISIIALVSAMTMTAQTTADVTLRLESQSGSVSELYLFAGPDLAATPERGSLMVNASNPEDINIYAVDIANNNRYGSFGDETLLNVPVGIITSKEAEALQNYTIHFEVYENVEVLKLKDLVTGVETPIIDGGSYAFTISAATDPSFVEGSYSTIADRFVINYTYVTMSGDFNNPGSSDPWEYLPTPFVHNGATASKSLTLDTDTWYHFKMDVNGTDAADDYTFDIDHPSHVIPAGWVNEIKLHTDVAGDYIFTWEYASRTLTITFPTPLPTTSITTNAYGFRSFAWAEDVEFLGGVKAYKGAFNPATFELTLTEVGTKVPAGAGVILWNPNATAETFYFNTSVDASSADMSGNDFVGAVDATPVAGISADAIYCLSGNQLMKYVGTDDIPAGKAYLPVSTGGAPAPKHIVMRFNGTQAIDNVEGEAVKAVKFVGEDGQILIKRGDEVFNLQGQKVNF